MQNLKPFSIFLFFFALASERIFIITHSIESTRVTGPENTLHTPVCLFQPGKVTGWGREGVNNWLSCSLQRLIHTVFANLWPITWRERVCNVGFEWQVPVCLCMQCTHLVFPDKILCYRNTLIISLLLSNQVSNWLGVLRHYKIKVGREWCMASVWCIFLLPASCGQCDVPAVVGEEEMLLNPVNQKSLLDPSDCNLSFNYIYIFFLVDCKKDCTILVKNVFDRLLHS